MDSVMWKMYNGSCCDENELSQLLALSTDFETVSLLHSSL